MLKILKGNLKDLLAWGTSFGYGAGSGYGYGAGYGSNFNYGAGSGAGSGSIEDYRKEYEYQTT